MSLLPSYDNSNKQNMDNLRAFVAKYPGWHSYDKGCSLTRKLVLTASKRGYVQLSDISNQFKAPKC